MIRVKGKGGITAREYVYKKVDKGSVVGRLTVLEKVGKSKNGSFLWECLCECGKTCTVISSTLNHGGKQSCGCLYDEVKGTQRLQHGMSGTKTYNSWVSMKDRCYDSTNQYYHLYGGRGITVCDRWLESFENFFADMGERPEGKTLDRVDVNSGYSKENCKWTDLCTQAFNTRMSKYNKSGRTGVGFHKLTSKYYARIKQKHLGLFSTFEEACAAREAAELKYYGFIKE